MKNQINEDNIRVAAYYIWEQAGRPEGQEKECWIKACEQLFAAGAGNNSKCCKSSCKSNTATKSTKAKSANATSSKTAKASSAQKTKKSLT